MTNNVRDEDIIRHHIPPVTRSQPREPLKPRKEMVIAEAVRKGITSSSSSAIYVVY